MKNLKTYIQLFESDTSQQYSDFFNILSTKNFTNDEKLKNFKTLVNSDYSVNCTNAHSVSILMSAIHHGNNVIVKFLIENGADVNVQTDWNDTPLMWFAVVFTKYEDTTILKYLLDAGATFDNTNVKKFLSQLNDPEKKVENFIHNNYPEIYYKLMKSIKVNDFNL